MKKSIFLCSVLALAGFGLGSCSSEQDAPVANADGPVTITARMPGNVVSRDYSDGSKATTLHYAVYAENTQTPVFTSEKDTDPRATYNNDLTFSLSLNLVKGQSYDLVFWADCGAGSPYTFKPELQSVTVSYAGILSNDENRDAFFSCEKGLTVTGAMKKEIKLYRPFAQLNIGTNDIPVASAAGITVGKTAVTVRDVYSKLNLFDGRASDAADVTFGAAALPTGEDFPVNGYTYLSMNYVLTGSQIIGSDVNQAQKETKDITISVQKESGEEINSFTVSAVPFQRNYRTNVFGALLTSTVDYEIEIVPDYNKPDNDIEVTDYSQLTNALLKGGAVTVPAGAAVRVPENAEPIELKDGTTLTVNGTVVGPKSGGIFTVPAGATVNIEGSGTFEFNYAGDPTQTENNNFAIRGIDINGTANIKDITMVCSSEKAGIGISVCQDAVANIENVTVESGFRAFQAVAGSKVTVTGGKFSSTSNNTVKDDGGYNAWTYCMHLSGAGCEATLDGVTVTGIQGAVAVGAGAVVTLKDCDVSTHMLEGKPNTAWHALYSFKDALAIVESGRFYAPTQKAVLISDNDIAGNTVGSVELRGGIFSSLAWNKLENKAVPLPDGFVWADNTDPQTKDKYPYAVVAK